MLTVRQLVGAVLALAQGIHGVMTTVTDFGEWEQRFLAIVQSVTGMLLVWAWERVDNRLLAERDRVWKPIGFRNRTMITMTGEVTIRRRLYRHQETGGYCCLLDEALGWRPQQRLSPRLLELAVTMSTELSFRQTSRWLGELVPGVSAMTVWSAAQRTAEQLDEQLREDREALERGTLNSPGRQPVPELHLEGDGVLIGLQQTDQTRGEVKLATGYSGKRRQGARCELEDRRTVAGLVDGQTIWDELTVVGGRCWDWSSVETVHVGGDGAAWVKQAVELFPQADYHLDVFHLRRALTEGLAFSQEHYAAVTEAVGRGDFGATMGALEAAVCGSRGQTRKRVQQLQQYITNQWDGIAELSAEVRLGTIEGQVRHVLTRRMKHIGARWSPAGGHHMARLLSARANDELEAALQQPVIDLELVRQALGEVVDSPGSANSADDLQIWLQAHVPALEGPHAARPWIKHVLRELTRVQPVA